MKKILYISVNTKEECDSSSKIVARKLIDEVLCQCRYKVPKSCKSTYIYDEDSGSIGEANSYKNAYHTHDDEFYDDINKACCEDTGLEKIICNDKEEKIKGICIDDECKKTDIECSEEKSDETITKENTCFDEKHHHKENCSDIQESKHEHNHIHKVCDVKNDECCDSDIVHKHEYLDQEGNTHGHVHSHDEFCCEEGDELENIYCDLEDECCDEEWDDCNEFIVEEIDLYKEYIPLLTHEFYSCRSTVVDGPGPCYESLTHVQRKDLDRIKALAQQFKEADIYIIAAPMWNLSFPAPLKQYLDCVILNGITVEISETNGCKGLLDDKIRKMVFVQSSGGELPILLKCKLDHSGAYLKDISKFLGIAKFEELLVDGTGYTACEKQCAIDEATKDIKGIARCLIK
ncbi:FMN-dependent NADH-azoreductase [uncultured Clostridium sp.]|uniref:FMN-dependent NADH-azoreductase n=1 Tax=uncultured Clostridium sp. TaxID=59620 RepID=UPI00261C2E9D|nr:NAD(P)H-dependent oxidoreductase [uncultured Clostridium sp.]